MSETAAEVRPWGVHSYARAAVAVAGVAVFFTALDNYAYIVWSGPPPLHLVYAFIACTAVFAVVDGSRAVPLLRSPVLYWILGYVVLTALWGIFSPRTAESIQAVDDRLRSIAFLVAFAILFDDPRANRVGVLAVAGAVVFTSLVSVAEALGAIEFVGQAELGRVPGRSGAFFINANGAGQAIALGAAIVVASVPRVLRVPLLVVAAAGVMFTFSRGSGLILMILIAFLVVRGLVSGWRLFLPMAPALALGVFGGERASRFFEKIGVLNENTWARLRLMSDDSGRVALAERAWELFQRAPFLGNGLASTGGWEQSPHNEYLALAADHGIAGLVLLPALAIALVLSNRRASPFALVLLVAGLFSHNLLEDRAVLLAVALAAGRAPTVPADEHAGAPHLIEADLDGIGRASNEERI